MCLMMHASRECSYCHYILFYFFFFKQKTAYELRISDWSSDVCSSDLMIPGLIAKKYDAIIASMSITEERKQAVDRSEERRVGKEWVSTCRSRWSPYH